MKKLTCTLATMIVLGLANTVLANQQPTDSLVRKVENLEKRVVKQQQEITELKKQSTADKKASNNSSFVIDRRGSKQFYKKP